MASTRQCRRTVSAALDHSYSTFSEHLGSCKSCEINYSAPTDLIESNMMSGATPGPSRLQLPSLAGPSISRPSTSATVSYRRDIRPDRANRVNVSTSRASNRTVFQRTSQHSSLVRVTTSSYNTGTLTPSGRRSRAASSVGGGEGHQIIGAVSESRGIVPTVGIAFINFSTGEAVLSEICDNQSFVKTINKVTIFKPSKILIISTASPPHLRSSLYSTIEEEVPDVPIVPLDRKYWSGNTGSEFIQALAFKEDIEGIKVAIDRKYYALASFCAVRSAQILLLERERR